MTTEIGTGNGHQQNALKCNEMTNFAAKLFSNITTANGLKVGNQIISPLLLEAILALLYLGSDGVTAEQLQAILQLNKRYASNGKMASYYAAELSVATRKNANEENSTAAAAAATVCEPSATHIEMCSRIFLPENYEISDEFRKIAQKYFHTQMSTINENATTTTTMQQQLERDVALVKLCGNENVIRLLEASTKQTKSSITASDAALADALLVVAARFQNKWFLPFSAYRTGLYEFHMNCGAAEDEQQPPKQIPMLFDDDMFVKFAEFRELDARAIELPYECDDEDEELSMLVILPNKRDGLSALLEQICNTDLTQLTEHMQIESVQVLLPKFKIDFQCSVRQSLEQLGLTSIFSKDANFKNLRHENNQRNLTIDNVLHSVCIEVNESGSVGVNVNIPLKPIVISNSRQKFFRADHPFLFAVRNRDAIYFIGQVTSF